MTKIIIYCLFLSIGNCAFIKFQDEAFRKYIYETLTEKQRLEYHKRCISYLFFHTKKCTNCNNKRFEIIDEFMLNGEDGIVQAKSCDNGKQMNENVFNIGQLFNDDDVKSHKPILLNFINHNFNQCSCTSILYSAFSNIIQHCHGGEMRLKLLYSQVILADICIKLSNIPRALILLDECFAQLNEITVSISLFCKKKSSFSSLVVDTFLFFLLLFQFILSLC
jgi:adenylate cyclase 10